MKVFKINNRQYRIVIPSIYKNIPKYFSMKIIDGDIIELIPIRVDGVIVTVDKNKITIPKKIVRNLNIKEGDEMLCLKKDGKLLLKKGGDRK